MERSARYKRKYVPSIDGLRALAVIAVIAYHLSFGWASGGFLGVDIFFCFIRLFNHQHFTITMGKK